ncbi:TetR family transcriptional regulator protein [Rhizobium gallicum]|uniref:TetR family transcriptional regulator protein n=2 Tax=Rhizobium gallicum TaxID=56730 RepID=A0A1L5NEJ1_9HYPH|nr:TetR family transcriptional regulator protein [Rhizobium gallicum]
MSSTETRPYHHGDLHRAIVGAALDVLSESQSTEFSLRELARRAGVSHNAPYKHFADKRELLAAVSAVGFELLAKQMTAATKELDSPRERLAAIARAYVSGGVNNPALYRLMFGGYLTGQDNGRPAVERTAAENMKALLVDAISDGALGRPIPNTAANTRKIDGAILIFWSQMHGLTLLLVDRLVGPNDKMEALTESVLQGMLDGLANSIPAIPAGVWVGPRPAE